MTSIIYETPMMVYQRRGEQSGTPEPPGAFKAWVLQSQKNPKYHRAYYLTHRIGFTKDDEEYDRVKDIIIFEKGLGNDVKNKPFRILHKVFGDLY